MGKLDVSILRHLTPEDFRVLTAIEMGMKNHALVPAALAASIANLRHGGVSKRLRELCQHKLLTYERGNRYDGFRLTNAGYDFLALKSLQKRNAIDSFGNQIGVGKESNIYVVADAEGQERCLKLHRLGRVCFKKVVEKRDYHKNRKSASWLYLSRISATKEFAYMQALYERHFPVPKPFDFNRHCVVMELVNGTLLNHVAELNDVDSLYDELMNVIMRFAESGVIHGDFNEFNVIVTEDEKPVIIDFPQMMSTDHPNAQVFFERDVNCVIKFFKKRFGFESETYPTFSDIKRVDSMDTEIKCTGFTKEMGKDLDDKLGLDESDDSSDGNSTDSDCDGIEEAACSKAPLDAELIKPLPAEKVDMIATYMKSMEVADATYTKSHEVADATTYTKNLEVGDSKQMDSGEASESECSECSHHEAATTAARSITSTIHPEEVKRRVKKQMQCKNKKNQRRKCVAKGEANAVTRVRRENRITVSESKGLWGYE